MIYYDKDTSLNSLLKQIALKEKGYYKGELDNWWYTKSEKAYQEFLENELPKGNKVKASSFADPADIKAFKRCKSQGKTDQQCFKVGDNGVGVWGDDTTTATPMCALPREDWEHLGSKARGAKVLVKANGAEVICELRDTMPRKRNIKNGAGIDLNEAACHAIGLNPPIMTEAVWSWI